MPFFHARSTRCLSASDRICPPAPPREPFCECCTPNCAHYLCTGFARVTIRLASVLGGRGECTLALQGRDWYRSCARAAGRAEKDATERKKRSRNTEDPDAYEGVLDSHKVQKSKFCRRVTPRVTFEAEMPRGASPDAEHSFDVHLREPDDFEASWASLMVGYTDVDHPQVTTPYPVSWRTLQIMQLWDAANDGGQNLHRLTSRHFARKTQRV